MENNKPASNSSDIDFDSVLEEITNIDVPVEQSNDLSLDLNSDLEKATPSNESAVDSTFDASVLEVSKNATTVSDDTDITNNTTQIHESILKEADYSAGGQEETFDSDITLDDVANGMNDNDGVDNIFDPVTNIVNVEEDMVNSDSSENSIQQDVFNHDSQNDFNNDFNNDELHNDLNQDLNAQDFNSELDNGLQDSFLQDDFNKQLDEDWSKNSDVNSINSTGIDTADTVTDSDDSFAALATPPPVKKQLDNTKLLKILAVVIALAIIGLLAFLFLGNSDSTADQQAKTPVKTAPKIDSEDKPAKAKEAQAKETAEQTEEKPAKGASKPTTPAVVDAKVPENATASEGKGEKAETKQADKKATETAENTAKTEEAKPEAKPEPKVEAKPTVGATQVNTPDPKAILNAEIPKDEALVKEEIDKLSDEDQRLIEQQKLLDKRIGMMDELTAKKQEQIELLEKQIAQLEAEQKKSN